MDLHDTIRTYRLFSGSYDIFFGPVFHPGRKEAVRIANDRPGSASSKSVSVPACHCRIFAPIRG